VFLIGRNPAGLKGANSYDPWVIAFAEGYRYLRFGYRSYLKVRANHSL